MSDHALLNGLEEAVSVLEGQAGSNARSFSAGRRLTVLAKRTENAIDVALESYPPDKPSKMVPLLFALRVRLSAVMEHGQKDHLKRAA